MTLIGDYLFLFMTVFYYLTKIGDVALKLTELN